MLTIETTLWVVFWLLVIGSLITAKSRLQYAGVYNMQG